MYWIILYEILFTVWVSAIKMFREIPKKKFPQNFCQIQKRLTFLVTLVEIYELGVQRKTYILNCNLWWNFLEVMGLSPPKKNILSKIFFFGPLVVWQWVTETLILRINFFDSLWWRMYSQNLFLSYEKNVYWRIKCVGGRF
jgi:hypothetical protein